MAPIHQHAKLLLRLLPRGREGDDALHQENGDLELALEPDCKSSNLGSLEDRELITLRTLGRWLPRPTSHATTWHHLSWRKGDPSRIHRDRRQRGHQERRRPTWNHHGPSGHRVDPGQPGRRRAHRWDFEREEFGRCCQGFGRRLVGRGQGEDRFGIYSPQDYRTFLSVRVRQPMAPSLPTV